MMKLLYVQVKKQPPEQWDAETRAMIETYGKKVDFVDLKRLEEIAEILGRKAGSPILCPEIRAMKKTEYPLLKDFLYEAIYVPEGGAPPDRSILDTPELRVYLSGFGESESDCAAAAEVKGKVVGAAWARIMNDYGHIDDETPSLAIAVHREYRGQGIGKKLLLFLMSALKEKGFERVSLSVQKSNPAVRLYQRTGFITVDETEEEYIMVNNLTMSADGAAVKRRGK